MQEIEDQVNEQMEYRKEVQMVGSVGVETYKSYLKAVRSWFLVGVVMFCIILGQVVVNYVDVYISKW